MYLTQLPLRTQFMFPSSRGPVFRVQFQGNREHTRRTFGSPDYVVGWMARGWTYGRTIGRTENHPILQDFVPYQGRCPASPLENQGESKAGQGNR